MQLLNILLKQVLQTQSFCKPSGKSITICLSSCLYCKIV